MEKKECPLCGKGIDGDEEFCADCREIADKSDLHSFDKEEDMENFDIEKSIPTNNTKDYPVDKIQVEDEDKEGLSTTTPQKKNNKLGVFLSIGLILLVIIGGIGSYVFKQNKEAEETETAFWNTCIEANTPLSYSKYLVRYPDGKYKELAQNKIVEIREQEKIAWQSLRKKKNPDAFYSFLSDYPNSPYESDVRHLIDSLSWINLAKENTAASYQAYLANIKLGHYSGEYKEIAQERYDYLSQIKILDGEELATLEKSINNYLELLSEDKFKEVKAMTADTLLNFYGTNNQLFTNLEDSFKAYKKQAKAKKVVYSMRKGTLNASLDNKGVCFINFTMVRETTYQSKKKKSEATLSDIIMELDAQKHIRVFYSKK